MIMKTYRVSQAAKIIGVSASSLRRYTSEGRIEDFRNPGGQRVYTQASIDKFLGKETSKIIVFYVRSSDGDKSKMDKQTDLLTTLHGTPTRVFKDVASGLNDKRRGLTSLLNAAEKGEFNAVAITQRDRLTRFGFTHLERLLGAYGVELLVSGEDGEKTPSEELMQDFMSLIASFSGKFYRLRGYQQQKQFLEDAGKKLG